MRADTRPFSGYISSIYLASHTCICHIREYTTCNKVSLTLDYIPLTADNISPTADDNFA